MDTTPFDIKYFHNGSSQHARIEPCCKADDVVDYAVWDGSRLMFTITKDFRNPEKWVVAMKNADDEFADEMIQQIGAAISREQSK